MGWYMSMVVIQDPPTEHQTAATLGAYFRLHATVAFQYALQLHNPAMSKKYYRRDSF